MGRGGGGGGGDGARCSKVVAFLRKWKTQTKSLRMPRFFSQPSHPPLSPVTQCCYLQMQPLSFRTMLRARSNCHSLTFQGGSFF